VEINLKQFKLKIMQAQNFRLYAKFCNDQQFKAVDCETGKTVGNLIYATIIPAENLGKLTENYKGIDPSFAKIEARSVETNLIIKINY
jgi:hypothetical protein